MTVRSWTGRGCAVLAALALQACGGGGNDTANNPSDNPITSSSTAHAQGTVYDASTGQVLAGAKITVAGQVLTTDGKGQFSLDAKNGQSLLAITSLPGYGDSQTVIDLNANSVGANLVINLTKTGASQALSVASGGSVSVPGSNAQVTLPAASLVNAATGQAATGNVTVMITPIDPASQSRAMPGTYKTDAGQSIESFGAIQVSLRDSAGNALQLAAGKTATIRIPVKTRSPETPATIALFYLKESTGLWVQEGSATLNGDVTNGFYYEGAVSHFSTWNADRVAETVFVEGCVRDANNRIPTSPVSVVSDGMDYSGAASASMGADGSFKLAVKRNARATLVAESADNSSSPVTLEPSSANIQRSTCLVLNATPAQPVFTLQPRSIVPLVEGQSGLLMAGAVGSGQLRYQWQRNGIDLPGQIWPMLVLPTLTMADNGTKYTVVASNATGSVTSEALPLVVVTQETMGLQSQSFYSIWNSALALLNFAFVPADTFDGATARMLAPAQICASGNVTNLSLDGRAASGGEAVDALDNHRIDVAFANCEARPDSDWTGLLTGTARSDFHYDPQGEYVISTSMTALGASQEGLQATGLVNVTGNVMSQTLTMTPSSGTTLTHSSGTGAAKVLTFTDGSMTLSSPNDTTSIYTYQNLTFKLDNVTYVLQGSVSYPSAPTDSLVLKANGQTIARQYYDANSPVPKTDITGTIPSF